MKINKTLIILALAILFCGLSIPAVLFAIEPPSSIQGEDITENSLILRWDAVAGAAKYEICSKESGGAYASSAVTGIFTAISSLTPKTSYYFKLRACASSANLDISDCESPVADCSKFTSAKKYTTLIGINDLKLKYEKLYQEADAKLQRYKDYMVKNLTSLASDIAVDFAAEIQAAVDAMKAKNETVKTSSDYNAVALEYEQFGEKYDLSGFTDKLKAYKAINGYYSELRQYQEKIEDKNTFKQQFVSHVAGAKTVYQSYETKLRDADINNKAGIKTIYSNLGSDRQFKFTSLVYKQLNYLDDVKKKLDALAAKIGDYSFLAKTTGERYNALAAATLVNYSNGVNIALWNNNLSYDTVNNIYQGMMKNDSYKELAAIVKGLKLINGILEKAKKSYDSIIGATSGSLQGTIAEDLAARSEELYASIQSSLGNYENRILDFNNDAGKIYKEEIRTYEGYKVYAYFSSGSIYLIDLKVNKIDILGSFINDLKCDGASKMLAAFNAAITLAGSAKSKLTAFALNDYKGVKDILYKNFTKDAMDSKEKYTESLNMAIQCF